MSTSEPHNLHRKRYAAKVEKGDNAWRREWNGFISGLNLKRVQDGSVGIALRTAEDLQQTSKGAPESVASASARSQRDKGSSSWNEDAEHNPDAGAFTFSYLFSSPADRKIAREAKRKAHAKSDRSGAEHSQSTSKHQQAILECKARGLNVEGMTRKEVRSFLNLTRTKEHEEAEQRAKEFKLHHLLDEKLAWYQQGPSPIDLISENLVTRKADKKGKRLGLRYNYLLPHPSWIAHRARQRRESILVGLGRRFVFDEETGVAMDPIHNTPVDLTKASLTFVGPFVPGEGRDADASDASMEGRSSVDEETEVRREATPREKDALTGISKRPRRDCRALEGKSAARDSTSRKSEMKAAGETQTIPSASQAPGHHPSTLPDEAILMNPLVSRNSLTRAVVRSRSAAQAIRKANLTTNYISSKLLAGTNAAGA